MEDDSIDVLTRSKNGVISGTLTGFANYYGLKRGRLQLVFLILGLFGVGFIFYFMLWISIPPYSQRKILLAEKLRKQQAQGEE